MCRITSHDNDAREERTGWGFLIATNPPFEEPPVAEGECGAFEGVALYADDEPVPLPALTDFTGLDFFLKESHRPDGAVYFTFDPAEAHDVSDVRIQFIEREGSRYRVDLSAIVYNVLRTGPAEVRYSGWINVTEGRVFDAEQNAPADRPRD
jgi:hypothetical protein